jgi:hypothetical protein
VFLPCPKTLDKWSETDFWFQETNDRWRLGGDYKLAVDDKSCLLHLPDDLEKKMPVDANHSKIVKFESSKEPIYCEVRAVVEKMLAEAPSVVETRFCM